MPGQGLRDLIVSPLEGLRLLEQFLRIIWRYDARLKKKLNLIIIGEGEACLVVYCHHYIPSAAPTFCMNSSYISMRMTRIELIIITRKQD
jgi:hypothetical protein